MRPLGLLAIVAFLRASPATAQLAPRRLVEQAPRATLSFEAFVGRHVARALGDPSALPATTDALPFADGVLVTVDPTRFSVFATETDAVGLPGLVAREVASHVAGGGTARVLVAADPRTPVGRVLHAISAARRSAAGAGASVCLLVVADGGLGLWPVSPPPEGLVRAPADALALRVERSPAGDLEARASPVLATRWSLEERARASNPRGLVRFLQSFRERDPDRKVAVLAVPGDARFVELAALIDTVRRQYPIVVLAPPARVLWAR